jgi:Domain of Unknown Function (DUF1543)
MQLYLIHLGYYDDLTQGVYECHTNTFVVADSFEAAKLKAKALPMVIEKKMHVDGMQRIDAVEGYVIDLRLVPELEGKTTLMSNKFRELAPQPEGDVSSSTI